MATKTTDWRPGPTVCRCCLSEGCYKDISTEYFWMGKREVYAEMLLDTYNLKIAYSKSGGPNSNSRLICEPCISRLRDATDFKRQVEECEKTFMQYLDPATTSNAVLDVTSASQIDFEVKVEQVKMEKPLSDTEDFDDRPDFGDDDDDDDDLDDQPLMNLATKGPKKESIQLMDLLDNAKAGDKRKSTTKPKSSPAKKTKSVIKLKKDTAKPSSSKSSKTEKKKKAPETHIMAKKNAEVVLEYSTAYPFRLQGRTIICVYCCEYYQDPNEFRQHMDEMHQTFTVSTAFAHFRFNVKVDLTGLKCRLCHEPYEDLKSVAQHINEKHDCKKLDLSQEIGLQPYKLDKGNWQCFICNKQLPTLVKLGRHTTAHYLKFTCDICGRNYSTNEALKYHSRVSHSGKLTCRKCWREFPDDESKKNHIRNSKTCWCFSCKHCGDRFMSWEAKQKHLVEVHGNQRITYECSACDTVFDNRKSFYKHYKVQHTDDNFSCGFCDLKFAHKKDLDEHQVGHTGVKLYKCSVCLKSFSRNKSLKQHMWIHSESKRFSCVICMKQFAQKISLKSHLKSHHPDVYVVF